MRSAAERARVSLAPLGGAGGTDYINASYVMVNLSITFLLITIVAAVMMRDD